LNKFIIPGVLLVYCIVAISLNSAFPVTDGTNQSIGKEISTAATLPFNALSTIVDDKVIPKANLPSKPFYADIISTVLITLAGLIMGYSLAGSSTSNEDSDSNSDSSTETKK